MGPVDIILIAVIAAAVVAAALSLRRKKRAGGCSCGCEYCSKNCPSRTSRTAGSRS